MRGVQDSVGTVGRPSDGGLMTFSAVRPQVVHDEDHVETVPPACEECPSQGRRFESASDGQPFPVV